eukprot:7254155-Heterocapsa_arctica.AAC.1
MHREASLFKATQETIACGRHHPFRYPNHRDVVTIRDLGHICGRDKGWKRPNPQGQALVRQTSIAHKEE